MDELTRACSDPVVLLAIVPLVVQSLVHRFRKLFQDTSSLPSSRTFHHKIPLLPGLNQ
jgi:hypothetical protein